MPSAIVLTAFLTLLLVVAAGISVTKTRADGLNRALLELDSYRRRDSAELQELKRFVRLVGDDAAAARIHHDDHDQIQTFVRQAFDRFNEPSPSGPHPFASWYVLAPDGRLLGVWPRDHDVVGQDFHDRDYFKGAQAVEPGEVYASKPFRSANDGLYKFALSTVIDTGVDAESEAVLAASVATDSTRAIAREERLMKTTMFWTVAVFLPSVILACLLLAASIDSQIRKRIRTV